MAGQFEEEEGGFFSYSEGPIRVALCKCTWMAVNTVSYGGFTFWSIFLLFQLCPPCRLTLNILSSARDVWTLNHSLLIGTELGVLALVAFLTILVPTMIMTWITTLIFEYVFGRALFGMEHQGLVNQGYLIAKDMTWMAVKGLFMRVNIGAVIILIISLLVSRYILPGT